jgi:hypothetical protein
MIALAFERAALPSPGHMRKNRERHVGMTLDRAPASAFVSDFLEIPPGGDAGLSS